MSRCSAPIATALLLFAAGTAAAGDKWTFGSSQDVMDDSNSYSATVINDSSYALKIWCEAGSDEIGIAFLAPDLSVGMPGAYEALKDAERKGMALLIRADKNKPHNVPAVFEAKKAAVLVAVVEALDGATAADLLAADKTVAIAITAPGAKDNVHATTFSAPRSSAVVERMLKSCR